jgi:microcystin-dependent protein
MATSFPGSLDSYVNPTGSDQLSTGPSGGVSHATMHSNVHDALSALQAKVGVDSSAVTSSLDYRMAQAEKNAPVGTVSMFAGAAAPDGWLLCQGQTVDYVDYPLLAAVFGVSGGSFTLPDLQQRVPVGSGTGYTLRGSGGSATDSITLAETNLPSHQHNVDHAHTVANHVHTMPNHVHTMPDHSHTIPDHNHSIPDHNHSISDPGHAHYITIYNNGTYQYPLSTGDFSGQGGTAVDSLVTDASFTGVTVNNKTDLSTNKKINFSTNNKTDYATNEKTDYSTNSKTDLVTNGPASIDSGDTGGGTAFDVDVVQPYFVLNFMIRVDD